MCLHYIKYEKWTSSVQGLFKTLGEIPPEHLAVPLAVAQDEALPPRACPARAPGLRLWNGFATSGPTWFLTTVPFFNWHKVVLGILAPPKWKALGPKTHWSCGVGRRREVFVYNLHQRWALLINQASLRCLAAGRDFSHQTFFFFFFLGEEHMEKFIRKLKLWK